MRSNSLLIRIAPALKSAVRENRTKRSFNIRITVWVLICNMLGKFSMFFNACTVLGTLKAMAWAWPLYSVSLNDMGGGYGLRDKSTKERHFILRFLLRKHIQKSESSKEKER
jgi:hypothetical protein